jgi:hypothetical protein
LHAVCIETFAGLFQKVVVNNDNKNNEISDSSKNGLRMVDMSDSTDMNKTGINCA